ncbi:MAG TPA: DUF1302 family protein [Methylomirabilota bacterium]|jgi:hypothetical protein|nr:DUF1302 family protein [Methylomirabilota bacterium]
MRERTLATSKGRTLGAAILALVFSAGTASGYFFDDRREMSLSGFFYSRATFATAHEDVSTAKNLWRVGNMVQHRNFLTLEWRHNINRISRDMPTMGPLFQLLNFDAFDYYLNMREEYDGVWDYGPQTIQKQLDGGGSTNYWDKYFGRRPPRYPGEYNRFKNFSHLTSIQWMEKKVNQIRLFEWYFNITKGPLFIRIGRQNLSWGETDGFRLLDQINPLDNLFGGFLVSLDERRVPLNMLRAQWSFGTVGPISDLTLEGFISPDRRTAAWYALNQGSYWNTHTTTSQVLVGKMPCGGPLFGRKNPGPNDAPGNGQPCSFRAQGPHSRLEDSRGGGRLIGTIYDFTFSLAHYYTWQDQATSAAAIISPTPAHLAWDLSPALFKSLTGKDALEKNSSGQFVNNPWGLNDQVVGAGGAVGGPGNGLAAPAASERNIGVPIREKRIQITGASLSFPVNALTGMLVGSDNPLYYIYTTFRGEVAYFRNVGLRSAIHDGTFGAPAAHIQRFLTLPLSKAGVTSGPFYDPEFLPGGRFSSEGNCTDASGVRGCRIGRFKSRDIWAFNIGLDHNQWLRWLNPNNSFTISAQLFMFHVLNNRREYDKDRPIGLNNDFFATGVPLHRMGPIGPNRSAAVLAKRAAAGLAPGINAPACILPAGRTTPPCSLRRVFPIQDTQELMTLAISTQYFGGNVRPSLTAFYDWSGAWLLQPGLDWTFYDPFRVSLRYNYLDGRLGAVGAGGGLGPAIAKDNFWVEFQYLLY